MADVSKPVTSTRRFFASPLWHVLCLLALLLIFWTDSLTPLGFDHGSLYLPVIFVVALTCSARFQGLLSILAAILILAGALLSPPGIDLAFALTNRAVTLIELLLLNLAANYFRNQVAARDSINAALHKSQRIIDQQRELLEIAADTTRLGGWSMTLPERHISWSDAVCRMHGRPPGYSPSLQEGMAYYGDSSREQVARAVQQCIEAGTPFDLEAELVDTTGKHRWVRVNGLAVTEADGRIRQIQGALQDISTEKEYQNVLVQMKHRFHQLADAVPQIIWTADPEGAIDYFNKALLDYTGMTDGSTLLGRGWLALVHPDDLQHCLDGWQRSLVDTRFYSQEFRIRFRDGSFRWHVVQAHPLKNEQGELVKWCGSAVDIHESRTLADRQINILESITDAFITIDSNWCFTYLNRNAEEMLQSTRANLLGKNVWEMFPGADNFRRHYTRAMEEQVPVFFEEYYAGLDKWFDIRAFPSEDGIIVYIHDITERQRRTDEMRQARERFEILARATTDAVWDWDLVTDAIWWNESMHTLFGYNTSELEPDSRSWTLRIHPDDAGRVLTGIHAVIDGNQSNWEDDYRFRRRDGTYAFVHDQGHIIRDTGGKAVRMVGGMIDITEKRLMHERLDQAQRLEALGQLTGGVAHDFNNLLTVIMGNGELLAELLHNQPDPLQLAQMINQAAARAGDLTRHLLAFARKQPLAPVVTDVKKLVNNMEALVRRTLPSDIGIEFVHAAGLWPALVDGSQLENALLNLCLNARDAMQNGGRLTIETGNAWLDQGYADRHNEVVPGQYVMLGVSDTGSGIPQETLMHVFDPFFTTKAPGKGTGLGLSMVYGFVKQSKGHIKIYTEVNHGTTVRLYLPRAVDTLSETLPQISTTLRGDNDVILLVEDDELVSAFAQTLLRDLGFQVLVATNGHAALALLRQHEEVKLLFTDIIMPGGMNGRQLADAATALRPGLKVLFTSGYTENAIVHHGRLDPGVNLLSKPYQRKDLISKIRQVLGSAD